MGNAQPVSPVCEWSGNNLSRPAYIHRNQPQQDLFSHHELDRWSLSRSHVLSSPEAGSAGLFFLSKRGSILERRGSGVIFTIRCTVQESEVNHVAAVWSEDL